MRRYLFLILFVVVLVTPFILRLALATNSGPGLSDSASTPRLVIISPHNQDIRREFSLKFSEWHQQHFGSPAILDFRSVGGTNDVKRMLETSYDGYRDKDGHLPPPEKIDVGYDVVWGGGDNFFDTELKPLGILDPLDPVVVKEAIPNPLLAGAKLYDVNKDDPAAPIRWAGVCLSSFGIVYNPDLLGAMHVPAPTAWKDLAVPQLAGALALADPTHSGSAAVAYMMVLQRAMADAESEFYAEPANAALKKTARDKWPAPASAAYARAIGTGWKNGMHMMLLIAANARYFSDSGETVPTDVGNGDAAAGMAIDFYGRVVQATVGPQRARFIAPVQATAITADPIAILYGTTGARRELADQLVQYLLSPQGQLVWIKKPGSPGGPVNRELGRAPIRPDSYKDETDWSDHIDPYHDAGTFNLRGAWMATFTESRMLWAAAWIDDRDALEKAYHQILAVTDDAKRSQLLSELADLPVTMDDALKQGAARKQAGSNASLWSAQVRTSWGARFRQHYADVAAKAN